MRSMKKVGDAASSALEGEDRFGRDHDLILARIVKLAPERFRNSDFSDRSVLADMANVKNALGLSPLAHAVRTNDHPAFGFLLAFGADADDAEALHLAANHWDGPELLRILLSEGCDPDLMAPDGKTVLMSAAMGGDLEMMRVILDASPDADAQSAKGNTALHFAAFADDPAAVKLLLDHGCRADIANHEGRVAGSEGNGECRKAFSAAAKQAAIHSDCGASI